MVSATVIAPTTEEADALATALCVLDPKRGIDLIDSLGEGYACLLLELYGDENLVWHESEKYKAIRMSRSDDRLNL
jgi:thiamine biosynthesis lipoprotein ApbE